MSVWAPAKMTPLEKEALDLTRYLLDVLTARVIKANDFMELMGKIKMANKRLEAAEGGCATGSHLGRCDCQPAVLGHAEDWKHRKKNLAEK